MKCNNCGHELKPGSGFCENCGLIISTGEESENKSADVYSNSDHTKEFDEILNDAMFAVASQTDSKNDQLSNESENKGEEQADLSEEKSENEAENVEVEEKADAAEGIGTSETLEVTETEQSDNIEQEQIEAGGDDFYIQPQKKKNKDKSVAAAVIIVLAIAIAAGAYSIKSGKLKLPQKVTDILSGSVSTSDNKNDESEDVNDDTTETTAPSSKETSESVSEDISEDTQPTSSKKSGSKSNSSSKSGESSTSRSSSGKSSSGSTSSRTSQRSTSSSNSGSSSHSSRSTTRPSTTSSTSRPRTTAPGTSAPKTTVPSTNAPKTTVPSTTQQVTTPKTTAPTTKPRATTEADTTKKDNRPQVAKDMGLPQIPSNVQKPKKFLNESYSVYSSTLDGIRFRSGPSEKSEQVASARYGREFKVLAKQGGWLFVYSPYYIKYGWVSAEFTTKTPPPAGVQNVAAPQVIYEEEEAKTVDAGGTTLHVRIGPGIDYKILASVADKTQLNVIGSMSDDDTWVYIQAEDGKIEGWVCAEFLK